MSDETHVPVLLHEALDALAIVPEGAYLDCTFGRGGHSRAILARLGAQGRLLALDRDPAAIAHAQRLGDARMSVAHAPFSELRACLAGAGIDRVHGVLFDLGVSSPQLADASRGMSFRLDGPLDMRMDPTRGVPLSQWLSEVSETQLREVIKNYGEERFARQVARAIVAARSRGPVTTTRQLAQIVAAAVPAREPGQDPATRTFQALRILINRELEELEQGLNQALGALQPGGRLVAISFHSLEDRIVKNFLRRHATVQDVPARLPLRADQLPKPPLKLVGRALRPGAQEVARNPRARSATLRVAEKVAA